MNHERFSIEAQGSEFIAYECAVNGEVIRSKWFATMAYAQTQLLDWANEYAARCADLISVLKQCVRVMENHGDEWFLSDACKTAVRVIAAAERGDVTC